MQHRRRVLIVDGDAALRWSLAEQVGLHGEFDSVQCDSAEAAIRVLPGDGIDAVLLDSRPPDMDGCELCRRLRSAGVAAPIVILGPAGSEADSTAALDAGASDYVTRPLRVGELLGRLRAHLRQGEVNEDTVLTIGPFAFRPSTRLLSDATGCRTVRLTDKEAAILKFLHRAGRAIGRDRLLDEVWGYKAGVTTHTLETHVYRLRRKIERDPANAEILVTEPGGYRLLP